MAATHEVGADFATALAESITRRGLTLQAISARLAANGTPVSVPTLSYWQTGRSVPTRSRSIKGVEALERILEITPGTLVHALTGTGGARPSRVAVAENDAVPQALAELGLTFDRNFQVITQEDQLVIAADRTSVSLTTRRVLRALRDKVDRVPLVHQHAGPGGGAPAVVALSGCRVGSTTHRVEDSLVAAELVLPRPLRQGEHHMVEYRIDRPCVAQPVTSFSRSLPSTMTALVVEVLFEGTTPAGAEHRFREHRDAEPMVRELPVAPHLVQLVGSDVQPGQHELAWWWQ